MCHHPGSIWIFHYRDFFIYCLYQEYFKICTIIWATRVCANVRISIIVGKTLEVEATIKSCFAIIKADDDIFILYHLRAKVRHWQIFAKEVQCALWKANSRRRTRIYTIGDGCVCRRRRFKFVVKANRSWRRFLSISKETMKGCDDNSSYLIPDFSFHLGE